MIPVAQPQSWFESSALTEPEQLDPPPAQDEETEDDGAFVRPFIVTGGRTRPLHDGLRIETLVVATITALSTQLHFEQRQIMQWCRTPISLAEIAALVGVPLGVARVLVADLYTDNLVELREPKQVPEHVLERIRDLVRA